MEAEGEVMSQYDESLADAIELERHIYKANPDLHRCEHCFVTQVSLNVYQENGIWFLTCHDCGKKSELGDIFSNCGITKNESKP